MKKNDIQNPNFEGQVIVDGVVYQIKNSEAIVCGFLFNDDKRKILEIPEKITHFPVTTIENSAFSLTKVERVILPWSLETIESDAFFRCENLLSVESIKPSSFAQIKSHRKFSWQHYPETRVGDFAFAACEKLQSVDVFQYLSCGGKKCFRGCKNLQYVSLLSTVRNNCFEDCNNLTVWNLAKYADISPGSLSGNLKTIRCTHVFTYSSSWSSALEVYQRLRPWGNEDAIIVTTPSQKFYNKLCECGVKATMCSSSDLSALEQFALCLDNTTIIENELEEMFDDLYKA